MEQIINKISDRLALTDAEEDTSLSVFDGNGNKMCAIGKPKVSESEAGTIKGCLTNSWTMPTRIKIGKYTFLCLRVSNTLLGCGNFNDEIWSSQIKDEKDFFEKRYIEKQDSGKLSAEKVTLSAIILGDFLVILMGSCLKNESLLKELKDIAAMLSNTSYTDMDETNQI